MVIASSISGLPIYAPSAAFAPTNGADVSAIASAYADPKLDATASGQFQPSGEYLSATESSNYYPTSNPSGFVTGVDLSDYVEKSSISAESSTWNNVTAKQDASAMTGYIPTSESANYYPASNPSGFISSVDLSDYATTSYVDSSVSSKLDTTAFSNVSGNFLTAVPAGYATESYVDSAVSGKLDVTASSQFLTSLPDDLAYTSDVASAVSGKMDKSESSSFYPMDSNPSGYLTAHQSLAGYATETYVDSAVSGKLDATAYDSAEFYTTANPSGFIDAASASAIASAYQVVSATATQLNAGTAYLTSVNDTPISAARAGNAANASLANSAWYDGTGRMISSLPDEATVSSIASAYAESAASGKLDATAQVVTSTGSASAVMMGGTSYYASQINGLNISAQKAYVADEWMHAGDKLDASASSSFYSTANESGYVDSAYVESQVSSKQDTLTFDWDADSAISSINGSALAGQGGGGSASIPFNGYYYDSATSATVEITADVSAVSSMAYVKHDGTVVNTYKGIYDTMGINHLGVASFVAPGAEINGKNAGGIPYTMSFAPGTSMWTTADAATGIFSPLQYGTGAGMFMDNSNFKGYLKGNEWFVSNTIYGYVRGEVHQGRGSRVIVEHTGGAGAVLSAKNTQANVTLNSTAYCTAQMAVANSHAYVQVQRSNHNSKYNSAKLDTDYLKFYNGMATGYLDPEDTASGTSYLPAETEYMYISSIPYWNAKLDASAIECDTASAITAIGGSAIGGGGGVDSATVSAIASSYAESATSGKVDQSAYDDLYSAFTALSDVISTYSAYFSSISSKVDNSAIGVIE